MSVSTGALRLEVISAHAAGWDSHAVETFRRGMAQVVERVERHLQAGHPSLRLSPRTFSTARVSVSADSSVVCAVAVLDLTGWDEQLALLVGRLQGARVPCIFVCRSDQKDAARRLGVSDSQAVTYGAMEDLFAVDSPLQQELLRAVPHARIHEELIYQFWFPRETSTVWVVCPQIHDPGEYADRGSPDYTYLDNLGDTDALLEVMVFLSQYYPKATIERFSAGDLPAGHTSGNLVVIGGPGAAGDISNDICAEMMRLAASCVSYSADCEHMTVARADGKTVQLQAEYRNGRTGSAEGGRLGLQKDYGYFARFANPLNENAAVVLVNGIHTRGVLGAAMAFSERSEALRNFNAVLASGVDPTRFECCFEVPVLNGQVKVPLVQASSTFHIGGDHPVAARVPDTTAASGSFGDGRASVRVLFIVGDRGGSQMSQLQTPNEYHAIQDALRASKHRDVIGLANPILGATRPRLAEAYRERPTVVHFAGHGSTRSLSIIEDQGALVREVPLTVDELCQMLRTIQGSARLCVLSTCDSAEVAQKLVEARVVEYSVGWRGRVSDSAAIAFGRALYGALGEGQGIGAAVQVATVACGSQVSPMLAAAEGADVTASIVGERERA